MATARGRPHARARCALSFFLALVACSAAGAGCRCTGGGTDAARSDAGDGGTAVAPVVRFRLPLDGSPPPFGEVPFPSDLYRDADGTLVDDLPGLERVVGANDGAIAAGLAPLGGFGRTAAAYFFMEGDELCTSTLPPTAEASAAPGSSVQLVDVDPASPAFGTAIPVLTRWQPTVSFLAVLPHPGTLLAPARRHALVVTTAVTTVGAGPYAADAELARILALPAGERTTEAELLYGEAADALVSSGAIPDTSVLAGLAVFTTASDAAADLAAMAAAVADPAVYADPELQTDAVAIAPFVPFVAGATGTTPTLDEWLGLPEDDAAGLDWPGGDNPGGRAHDAVGAVLTGAFETLLFLGANGHVVPDDGSAPPAPQGTWLVPVTFVFPAGAPPAGGWPVVIFGHGLGGSRHSMLGTANEYCRAGFAVAGIDFVYHGTRDSIPDLENTFPGTWEGPDGFPDMGGSNVTFFAFFSDLLAVRDNFRQTVADLSSLVRLLRSPSLDLSAALPALGGETPLLDGGALFYDGRSLGGIIGTLFAAVAPPEVRAAVLHVPGGGFMNVLAPNAAGFQGLLENVFSVVYAATGDEPFDSFHPLSNLFTHAYEAADPLVSAPHLVLDPIAGAGPRHVLVVYAIDDETVPNRATHALLLAAGLPVAAPALVTTDSFGRNLGAAPENVAGNFGGGTITAVAMQYAPATHSLGGARYGTRNYLPGFPRDGEPERFPPLAAPVTIELPIREILAGNVAFLTGALSGGVPAAPTTVAPVADFDGDGVLDEDELAAGTDPYDPASY